MIKVINVTKKYKKLSNDRSKVKYALDNVSLNIPRGKIIALLGVNGSGKSTLLKIMSGLIKPTSGKIVVDDESLSYKTYEKLIFVPDFETHFSGFKIEDMINFYKDFYKTWNDEKADEMLEFFDLKRDSYIDSLSRGNIAKVKLVLSFSLDMKYILLDEPFNGIDVFKREEFVSMIARYMNEDQSVVITTHEINEIESVVDYVYILNDGRLVSSFDAEDLRFSEGKSILDKVREVSLNE